jgi:hypothetical protein
MTSVDVWVTLLLCVGAVLAGYLLLGPINGNRNWTWPVFAELKSKRYARGRDAGDQGAVDALREPLGCQPRQGESEAAVSK